MAAKLNKEEGFLRIVFIRITQRITEKFLYEK
jgi:hypothetical protein